MNAPDPHLCRRLIPGAYILKDKTLRPATLGNDPTILSVEDHAARMMENLLYIIRTGYNAGNDASVVHITDNQNVCHVNLYNMSFTKLKEGEDHTPLELGRNLSAILRFTSDLEATRLSIATEYGDEAKGVPILAVGGIMTHDYRRANTALGMIAAMNGIESDFYPAQRIGLSEEQLREKFKNVHDLETMSGFADFLLKSPLRLPHALRPIHDFWTYDYYKYAEPDYEPGAILPTTTIGRHLS